MPEWHDWLCNPCASCLEVCATWFGWPKEHENDVDDSKPAVAEELQTTDNHNSNHSPQEHEEPEEPPQEHEEPTEHHIQEREEDSKEPSDPENSDEKKAPEELKDDIQQPEAPSNTEPPTENENSLAANDNEKDKESNSGNSTESKNSSATGQKDSDVHSPSGTNAQDKTEVPKNMLENFQDLLTLQNVLIVVGIFAVNLVLILLYNKFCAAVDEEDAEIEQEIAGNDVENDIP